MAHDEDEKGKEPPPAPLMGEGKTQLFSMKLDAWLQDFAADIAAEVQGTAPGGAPRPAAVPPPGQPLDAPPKDPVQPPVPAFPGLLDPSAPGVSAALPMVQPADAGPPAPPQAPDPFAATMLASEGIRPSGPPAEAPAPLADMHAASAVPPIPALIATAVPPIPGLAPGAPALAPVPAPAPKRWTGVVLTVCLVVILLAMGTGAWILRADLRALLKL